MQTPPTIRYAALARPDVAAKVRGLSVELPIGLVLMKRKQATRQVNVAASARGQSLAPPRQRNARMDALVKHVHASEKFSFVAACAAIGAALSKVKAAS